MIFSVTSSCLQLLIHLDVHRCSYYMNVKMQNYINVNTTARLRPPFRFGAQAFEAQWLDKRWTRFVFWAKHGDVTYPAPNTSPAFVVLSCALSHVYFPFFSERFGRLHQTWCFFFSSGSIHKDLNSMPESLGFRLPCFGPGTTKWIIVWRFLVKWG